MFFDKGVFKGKGIHLWKRNKVFKIINFVHHCFHFKGITISCGFFVEILTDAIFQVFGLTHIDDIALSIEVLVYTGTIGQEGKNILYMSTDIGQYRISI